MGNYTVLEFHKDCVKAINECPQVSARPEDFYDHLGTRSRKNWRELTLDPVKVFNYWSRNSTLWHSGYHEHLSPQAKNVFAQARAAAEAAIRHYLPEHKVLTSAAFDPPDEDIPF